ncbi:MAG: hypothetical protein ACT4P8_12125, partial [Betaproteobacteria bacterium]
TYGARSRHSFPMLSSIALNASASLYSGCCTRPAIQERGRGQGAEAKSMIEGLPEDVLRPNLVECRKEASRRIVTHG